MEGPQKSKYRTTIDPAIPLLGIHPDKTTIQKDTCSPIFTAAFFTMARTRKQSKHPSTDEWIKEMWGIYTMEYCSVIKEKKIMPFAGPWMQLESLILGDVRERQIPHITYI